MVKFIKFKLYLNIFSFLMILMISRTTKKKKKKQCPRVIFLYAWTKYYLRYYNIVENQKDIHGLRTTFSKRFNFKFHSFGW